jgi:hypothetical protein
MFSPAHFQSIASSRVQLKAAQPLVGQFKFEESAVIDGLP